MDWESRQVLILGAGRQGTALARYLASHGASVVVNDHRSVEQLASAINSLADLDLEWVTGEHPLSLLDRVDLICVSGGVPLDIPLIAEARRRGLPLSNDSQIFLERAPCQVIGITGSAGKSTTTALVGQIARVAASGSGEFTQGHTNGRLHPRRVWVGGNIGLPLIEALDQMSPEDLAVMELSSFQLEIMTTAPRVAAVLNITPNHLDRHGTMVEYTAAKARILDYQSRKDIAVLNREDPVAWSLVQRVRGKLLTFGLNEPPEDGLEGTYVCGDAICFRHLKSHGRLLPLDQIRLPGEHNILNVLAAGAIALAAGLPLGAIPIGVGEFKSLPHRLEYVRSWGGAEWYNDSIATAPERAMAAIRVFQQPIILLAGGRDKDLDWSEFANLVRRRVDHLVVFGEAAEKVLEALDALPEGERPLSVAHLRTLSQAVQEAARLAKPGYVVLLSPGGTSYDEFRDFEERGESFKRWVRALS